MGPPFWGMSRERIRVRVTVRVRMKRITKRGSGVDLPVRELIDGSERFRGATEQGGLSQITKRGFATMIVGCRDYRRISS